MKKNIALLMCGLALILLTAYAETVLAADEIKEFTVQSAVLKIDKNGNEYVRFIVPEKKSIQGITYEAGVPIMAFGETVAPAKAFKEGDKVKAVVSKNDYNGRTSYTVVAFVQ